MNNTRYDVGYTVSSGKCGFRSNATFIGKPFSAVIEWKKALKEEYENCIVSFDVWEGWGFNQRRLTDEELKEKGWY